jgi:hypothetical protein
MGVSRTWSSVLLHFFLYFEADALPFSVTFQHKLQLFAYLSGTWKTGLPLFLKKERGKWQKYLSFVIEVITCLWFWSVDIHRMFVNRLELSSFHAAVISENSIWWLQSSRKRTHEWSGFYSEIWHWMVVYGRCAHTFKESSSHFKILAARRMTWSAFHIKDPHILCASIQN